MSMLVYSPDLCGHFGAMLWWSKVSMRVWMVFGGGVLVSAVGSPYCFLSFCIN